MTDKQPRWNQRGPVDKWGRPIMPKPSWVGGDPEQPPVEPEEPPVEPEEPPPVWTGAADPLPRPQLPITRYTPFRGNLDCGLAAWKAEHTRISSPIPVDQQEKCYAAVNPWSAQALATGVKETELGKTARGNNNVFNLFVPEGTHAKDFSSWEQGAKEWYARYSDPSYKPSFPGVYMPRDISVEQAIVTYQGGPGCYSSRGAQCANGETWSPCQGGSSTSNSIELSVQQFVARVNTSMGFVQKVPWTPVAGGAGCAVVPVPPPGAPVQYTLSRDYARFGITKAQADKIIGNCFPNRSGQSVLASFVHVQEGTTPGSLNWWATGPGVQASSTCMIQQDGSVLWIIDPKHGPWTNGDVCSPTAKGRAFLDQCMGGNPNLFTNSIENEGYWNKAHSNEQLDANVWVLKTWEADHHAQLANQEDLYPHGSVNQCSRPNCCGAEIWNGILARL